MSQVVADLVGFILERTEVDFKTNDIESVDVIDCREVQHEKQRIIQQTP